MSDNNGFPSMTALLGLLAVAGYQNRDKLADWFGSGQERPAGQGRSADLPEGLGGMFANAGGSASAGGIGGLLGGGIQELIERFKHAGRGNIADSWVGTGPNVPVTEPDLEQAIGSDVLDKLAVQTGLNRQEILARLAKRLPDAIDQYTPEGRVAV